MVKLTAIQRLFSISRRSLQFQRFVTVSSPDTGNFRTEEFFFFFCVCLTSRGEKKKKNKAGEETIVYCCYDVNNNWNELVHGHNVKCKSKWIKSNVLFFNNEKWFIVRNRWRIRGLKHLRKVIIFMVVTVSLLHTGPHHPLPPTPSPNQP